MQISKPTKPYRYNYAQLVIALDKFAAQRITAATQQLPDFWQPLVVHHCWRTSCTSCAVYYPLGQQWSIVQAPTWCQDTDHAPCFMLTPQAPTLFIELQPLPLLAPFLNRRSMQAAPHHRLLSVPALAPHLRAYCHLEMTALTQVLTFSTEPTVEK
jgi:hypothetical protein